MSKNYIEKNFTRIEKLCKKLDISCKIKNTVLENTITIDGGNNEKNIFVIDANPIMLGAGLFSFTAPGFEINNPVYLSIRQIERIIVSTFQM
jgi:pentose-5-phosphate-3-epimerase